MYYIHTCKFTGTQSVYNNYLEDFVNGMINHDTFKKYTRSYCLNNGICYDQFIMEHRVITCSMPRQHGSTIMIKEMFDINTDVYVGITINQVKAFADIFDLKHTDIKYCTLNQQSAYGLRGLSYKGNLIKIFLDVGSGGLLYHKGSSYHSQLCEKIEDIANTLAPSLHDKDILFVIV